MSFYNTIPVGYGVEHIALRFLKFVDAGAKTKIDKGSFRVFIKRAARDNGLEEYIDLGMQGWCTSANPNDTNCDTAVWKEIPIVGFNNVTGDLVFDLTTVKSLMRRGRYDISVFFDCSLVERVQIDFVPIGRAHVSGVKLQDTTLPVSKCEINPKGQPETCGAETVSKLHENDYDIVSVIEYRPMRTKELVDKFNFNYVGVN